MPSNLLNEAKRKALSKAGDATRDPAETLAPAPAVEAGPPRTASLDNVAPNPRNTRRIRSDSPEVLGIKKSIEEVGQLSPCAVVTRAAFLRIFPEYETDQRLAAKIADAAYVQVNGGQRWVALQLLGDRTMEIVVKDDIAASRDKFLVATMDENIKRKNYDPVEEAQAVLDLANELGQKQLAGERLGKSPTWVTQRLVLLELEPEIQEALRGPEDDRFPVRRARELGDATREEQLAALEEWKRSRPGFSAEKREDGDEDPAPARVPAQRVSGVRRAILKLGTTPVQIGQTLRHELTPEDRRAVAEELLRDD